MFKNLRQKIEGKRYSKNLFWRLLVFGKDFVWKAWVFKNGFHRLLRTIRIIIKLRKLDSVRVPHAPDEIRLFMVVRNESLRLPYIFKYYSRMGVNRFFVIDNGSTDGTVSFLLSRKNTHVFKINESYGKYNCGVEWIRVLLGKYGRGHWCLVVDADEIFIYPHYEKVSIRGLCNFLDKEGSTALYSMLLDMYSNEPIRLAEYKQGENPLLRCPYFDKDSHYRLRHLSPQEGSIMTGGMRERIFSVRVNLDKVPLLKFKPGIFLGQGQHHVLGTDLSEIEGAVFHFRYLSDFLSRALAQAKKIGEHGNNRWTKDWLLQNKGQAEQIIENPDINPYYPGSVQFKNSNQLVDLKIMKASKGFEAFVKNLKNENIFDISCNKSSRVERTDI